jgi:hypothetical protein
MNDDSKKTATQEAIERRFEESRKLRQEELTKQLATIILGVVRSGDGFYFKSEHQLQLFARICENAGALAVIRSEITSAGAVTPSTEKAFMQRGQELLNAARECSERNDGRKRYGDPVLDKAAEVVRAPLTKLGFVDVGDVLVRYIRGDTPVLAALEYLDNLADDYRRARAMADKATGQ